MAQRHSEYPRQDADLYITPRWVYDCLYSVEPWAREAWDCCPINASFDFTKVAPVWFYGYDIATNPPFSIAEKIIRHALAQESGEGRIAMLLPHAFDAAKGRVDLWGPPFKIKYTLTSRIRWENLVQKKAGPSMNHAWYVWDLDYDGPPMMGWIGGKREDKKLGEISTLPEQGGIAGVDKTLPQIT
jgi:hypothetical protein